MAGAAALENLDSEAAATCWAHTMVAVEDTKGRGMRGFPWHSLAYLYHTHPYLCIVMAAPAGTATDTDWRGDLQIAGSSRVSRQSRDRPSRPV